MAWFKRRNKKENEEFSLEGSPEKLSSNKLSGEGFEFGEGQNTEYDPTNSPSQLLSSQPHFSQQTINQPLHQYSSPIERNFSSYPGEIGMLKKEFEVLSSKMDTLKAMLESISQRLSNVERKLYEEEKRNRLW